MKSYDSVKRAIDVVTSGIGLVVTAPAQVIVGAAGLETRGRPVLLRQPGPSKGGQT